MMPSLQDLWERVWTRVRSGRHTMIVGSGGAVAIPSDLKVLCIPCATPLATEGPLDNARQKVERLLGVDSLSPSITREQLLRRLRSELLGDFHVRPIDAVFVEECNQLADWAEGHAAILFESIDSTDEATIATLVQILRRPNWLRLPLIFTLQSAPQGPVADLLTILRTTDSDEVLIEFTPPTSITAASPVFEWASLPNEVLRVLRAGAVIGTTFKAELVARLIDEPLGSVLEKLQSAVDAGAPLTDWGEGQFCIPPEAVTALQSRMLASLLTFYHKRLGTLLSAHQPGQAPQSAQDEHSEQIPGLSLQELTPERSAKVSPSTSYADLFTPTSRLKQADLAQRRPAPEVQTASPAPLTPIHDHAPTQSIPQTRPQDADHARAASHLQQAGQVEAAVEEYIAAVRKLAVRGDVQRAYLLARQALKPLEELPPSASRAVLQAQLLLEIGRLQWQAATTGSAFTLQEALASLMEAESSLPDTAPPELRGQLATVTAGVCCDLGDLDSLQWALNVLTEVSRQLMAAGESRLAGRLLNDQAAVQVRLGDPVLAAHLLTQSEKLFEDVLSKAPGDRMAVEELAETHHLLARMPLHAGIRPGREEEAYSISLSHAHEAERTYRLLGQQRELTRVWETVGRLELQRGQLEAAQERLAPVLNLQQKIGDMMGLARSTAALADVFIQTDRLEEAATLLANSITFNFQKGSPLGLAFNRRAFETLEKAVSRIRAPQAAQTQGLIQQIEEQLSEAEAVLGRLVLPGEVPGASQHRG